MVKLWSSEEAVQVERGKTFQVNISWKEEQRMYKSIEKPTLTIHLRYIVIFWVKTKLETKKVKLWTSERAVQFEKEKINKWK